MKSRYFLLCCLLLFPFSAVGHSKLLSSDPEEGAVLSQPPSMVTLSFNKPIESRFNRAELWQGEKWVSLPLEAGPKKLVIRLEGSTLSSEYRIRWSVMSHDGHRQKGILHFLVK